MLSQTESFLKHFYTFSPFECFYFVVNVLGFSRENQHKYTYKEKERKTEKQAGKSRICNVDHGDPGEQMASEGDLMEDPSDLETLVLLFHTDLRLHYEGQVTLLKVQFKRVSQKHPLSWHIELTLLSLPTSKSSINFSLLLKTPL